MYGVVLSEETGMDAVQFAQKLLEKGVETRPFFLGMHEQPVFNNGMVFKDGYYPIVEMLARQGLYLPSGLSLNQDQLGNVCKAVHEVFHE